MRERRSMLGMEMPVALGNLPKCQHSNGPKRFDLSHGIWTELPILYPIIDCITLGPWDIDNAVDNGMCNMHALRTKFPG